MKKILYSLLIITFFFQNGFSQEYTFDSYYEYVSNGNITFFMTNSENENYIFFGHSGSDAIYGHVYDITQNKSHYFDVKNVNDGVTFTYLYSKKIIHSDCNCTDNVNTKKVSYRTHTEIIDSLKSKTIIEMVKIKKSGKIKSLAKLEMTYLNNEKFIFHHSHLIFYTHHSFNDVSLFSNTIKLPLKVDIQYPNGFKNLSNLIKKQKIKTTLIISNENIKYN